MKENIPIRKRGYYRAVKAGKKWATTIAGKNGMDFLLSFYFRTVDFAEALKNHKPFLRSIPDDSAWRGGTIIVPFKIETPK